MNHNQQVRDSITDKKSIYCFLLKKLCFYNMSKVSTNNTQKSNFVNDKKIKSY